MISQIEGNVNKKVFAPIQGNGVQYAIAKPITDTQIKAQAKEQKKIDEKNEDAKTNQLGIRITEIALLSTVAVFVVLGVKSRNLRNWLDQKNKNWVDKTAVLRNSKRKVKKLELITKQILQKMASKSKALFNLAPLKDVLLAKIMNKSKFWSKVAVKTTNMFEKISVKTSRHSYNSTTSSFETMFATFADANKKIPKERAKLINEKIANIRHTYNESFSETARNERLETIKRHFDGYDDNGKLNKKNSLMSRVWADTYQDYREFFKKNTYLTFVSEELAAKEKMRVYNEVFAKKILITNSLPDICKSTYNLFIHLDTFIEPKDNVRELFKKVINTLKRYEASVKNKDKEGARNILMNGVIPKNLEKIDEIFAHSKKYDKSTTKMASENIKQLVKIYNENQRGELQNIMGIYKEFLTEKDYQQLKKQINKPVNKFNHSVNIETDKLFDKIRDLKIGSAPKDSLGVLASLGIVGYQLKHADDRDERISVTVKYGIPTVGAVAIAVYCTVGLISAGPSLLIGLASGLALNQVGQVVDKMRKKYMHSELSFQNIALPESVQTIRRNLDLKTSTKHKGKVNSNN